MLERGSFFKSLRGKAGVSLRFGLTFLIFWLIFTRLDTGDLGGTLRRVRWPWCALGFAALLCRLAVSSAATARLLRGVDVSVSFLRVLKVNLFSVYLSHLSQFAGGALRWSMFAGQDGRRGEAFFVIFLERLLRVSIQAVFFWAAFWAGGDRRLGPSLRGTVTVLGAVAAAVFLIGFALLWWRRANLFLVRFFSAPSGGRIRNYLRQKFLDLVRVWGVLQGRPRQAFAALGLMAAGFVFTTAGIYALARSVNAALPPAFLVMVMALVGIAQNVPLTVCGLGIREGMLVYFLPLCGVSPGRALAIAILALLPVLFKTVLGGIWFFAETCRRAVSPELPRVVPGEVGERKEVRV